MLFSILTSRHRSPVPPDGLTRLFGSAIERGSHRAPWGTGPEESQTSRAKWAIPRRGTCQPGHDVCSVGVVPEKRRPRDLPNHQLVQGVLAT